MSSSVVEPVKIGRSVVRLIRGDITMLDVDAFVFYARHDLALGAGFGNAISVRGGLSIKKELDELGPLQTGEAVVTGAGNLNASYIIHAVGPRFNEADTEAKLRATVLGALRAADERGVKRVALPPMGAGFYAIPLDVCSSVMVRAIKAYLEGETNIEEVLLCVMDQREYAPFESQLASLNR